MSGARLTVGAEGKIRILVVEDHALVRESLARTLEAQDGFEVVGGCSGVDEGLALAAEHQPDVVLLDYDLGAERGTRFLTEAPRRGLAARILIVTAWVTQQEVRRLVMEGAAGIFSKQSPLEEIVEGIRTVAAGGSAYDQRYVKALLRPEPASESPASVQLTGRERIVMRCVLEGMTSKEIGNQLSLSEAVVKIILQRLFEKGGVRTRAQLVRVALENRWL